MKAEDITRANTRKEMNNIAIKMGMGNPESFSTKSELAEEMVKYIDEHGIEDELEKKVESIKNLLKDVRETNLDLTEFKKGFKKMRTAKNEYNIPKAVELADYLIKQGESLLEAREIIDEIKGRLGDFPGGDVKSGYKEDLKKLINGFKEGEYSHRVVELKELYDDIEDHYELKKKLEDKFPSARQKLSELRKIDVDIGMLKKLVNAAVQARKRGAYQEGIDDIDEFLEQSEIVIEVSVKIEECKSYIRELKKLDLDIDHYIRIFQTAKQKADSGDYQYSLELLKDINDEMRQDIEKAKESLEKEELEEVEEAGIEEEPVETDEVEETVEAESEIEIEEHIYPEESLKEINRKLDDMENHLFEIKQLLEKLVEK
ncbi:MAG: hypothetical protein ACQEQM_06505 [Thermoplasmatota archaeon]